MKVLAVNGSPRKTWNTAKLLSEALEGAASVGAETELVHLYDLNFKGCASYFDCKLKNGKSYGRCSIEDDLSPVLDKIPAIDALILGSPIYLGTITGELKMFLERLTFPYLVYDAVRSSLFPKKLPVGFIYTMGAPEQFIKNMGIDQHVKLNENLLAQRFGSVESLLVTDTYQFDDYSKYVQAFNVEEKTRRHKDIFPIDCKKAFEMGARLAKL